jgi:molecular chaperone GrpE
MSEKKNIETGKDLDEESISKEASEGAGASEGETSKPENKEAEYLENLKRLGAEFDNFQKRTLKEKQEILVNANASLITQLLPVLDNFELSLKHNKDKGVALIHDELSGILEKQGLKAVDVSGKFDPNYHEVLMQEDGEADGKILEEIQKGYMLNDKLLRASKVKISRIKTNE